MEQSLVENFKKSASHLLTQCRETGFIVFFSLLRYLYKAQTIFYKKKNQTVKSKQFASQTMCNRFNSPNNLYLLKGLPSDFCSKQTTM